MIRFAAEKNCPSIVRLLISERVDPQSPDEYGETLLARAVERELVELTRVLLSSRADPNAYLSSGKSLLHSAAENSNLAITKALLENGAHVNILDKRGRTPFDLAHSVKVKEVLRSYGAVSGEELKKREGK
jgi:ankyrin repeat protein